MNNSWLQNDMIRICPQTGETLEQIGGTRDAALSTPLSLASPRNAYVSFQVIVNFGLGELPPELELTAEPLRSPEGGAVESEEYRFYSEWYHDMQGRYFPDALVPWGAGPSFRELTLRNAVPGQRFGAIWVDLFVPVDAAPGRYSGRLFVKSGESSDAHIVTLDVLPVTVPYESAVTMDLNSYADSISPRFEMLKDRESRYTDGSYFRVEQEYYKLAHEHRALFHSLPYNHSGRMPESFYPAMEGAGKNLRVKDWSLFDEHFGPYLDGSAFQNTKRGAIPLPFMYLPFNFHWPADYAKFGTKGYRTEFSSVFKEFHAHFSEKGWLRTRFELFLNHKKRYKLFPYDGDETRFVWDEKINDQYYELTKDVLENKDGARFTFRTDSSWSYGLHAAKYADMITHWVVNRQIFMWYPEAFEWLRAKGNTVWIYGGAQPISSSLLGTALTPLACSALGIHGFTFWNVIDAGPRWEITPAGNGNTAFFYPADRVLGIPGPIPSLRLKVLRNATQAADCIEAWIRDQGEDRREDARELIASGLGKPKLFAWPERPAFTNDPPYLWSNERMSEAVPPTYHEGVTVRQYELLTRSIWKLLNS